MNKKRRLTVESLEHRHLMTSSAWSAHLLASKAAALVNAETTSLPQVAAAVQAASAPVVGSVSVTPPGPSYRQFLSSSDGNQIGSDRWDWLAGTEWFVPVENLLAYSVGSDLSDPQAVGDQTIWQVNESHNGLIAGESITKLSSLPVPTTRSFTGVVTEGGQVRIEFEGSTTPTTGIGQMRFVDGQWRVQMQMVTSNESVLTHWAYMSVVTPDTTPPEPGAFTPDENLVSNEWRWLAGTHWGIVDSGLFGSDTAATFEITDYRNGYYWGSGTSSQPFNILGSVTPEGNVLFVISLAGATPVSRTGLMRVTSTGAAMALRAYEGTPDTGAAWTIGTDPA